MTRALYRLVLHFAALLFLPTCAAEVCIGEECMNDVASFVQVDEVKVLLGHTQRQHNTETVFYHNAEMSGNLAWSILPLPPSLDASLHAHPGKETKSAFLKSFVVVSIAEIFDKTWFMSLLLALKHGWKLAFAGSYLALAAHCGLSALLGLGFQCWLKLSTLRFITAGIFSFFAMLYLRDVINADPENDLIRSGKQEAEEDLEYFAAEDSTKTRIRQAKVVLMCFVAVFIAEWGDRTQMAMIALHSSHMVLPVLVGSAVAFFVICLSAVVLARVVPEGLLSERLVLTIATLSFSLFAALAFIDAFKAKARGE